MNYQWHYDRLVSTRRGRLRKEGDYYERHHIIPKSMGGNNDESNIVLLTAREHFLAHWLLWRIHRNRQTAYAFYTFKHFFSGRNHLKRPEIISARGFDEAREAYSNVHRERMIGKLNSNRSKVVIQCDMDGVEIRKWPSAKEAYRILKICHITSCCRGERVWAGGFRWKYENSSLKKSKPYKKRNFTKKKETSLTEDNRKRISNAVSDRKWYNDGKKDFFLKPFDSTEDLTRGRLATRKLK